MHLARKPVAHINAVCLSAAVYGFTKLSSLSIQSVMSLDDLIGRSLYSSIYLSSGATAYSVEGSPGAVSHGGKW